jgi:hypothetical protein
MRLRKSAWRLEGVPRHLSPSPPERHPGIADQPVRLPAPRGAPGGSGCADDGGSLASLSNHQGPETEMLDIIFIASGLAFFAVGILYVIVCDRL